MQLFIQYLPVQLYSPILACLQGANEASLASRGLAQAAGEREEQRVFTVRQQGRGKYREYSTLCPSLVPKGPIWIYAKFFCWCSLVGPRERVELGLGALHIMDSTVTKICPQSPPAQLTPLPDPSQPPTTWCNGGTFGDCCLPATPQSSAHASNPQNTMVDRETC